MNKMTTIPPWTRRDCDECGIEFQASRTKERASKVFLCESCESYAQGLADGEDEINLLRKQLANLGQELEMLQGKLQLELKDEATVKSH